MADTLIVLDDGSEKDAEECRRGVQVIVQEVVCDDGKPRREVLLNFEYYFYDSLNGRWRGTNDPFSALMHHRNGEALLHSSMMADAAWRELRDKYLHRK